MTCHRFIFITDCFSETYNSSLCIRECVSPGICPRSIQSCLELPDIQGTVAWGDIQTQRMPLLASWARKTLRYQMNSIPSGYVFLFGGIVITLHETSLTMLNNLFNLNNFLVKAFK